MSFSFSFSFIACLAMLPPCAPFTPTDPILLIGDSIVSFFPVSEYLPGKNLSTWGIYGAKIETLTERSRDIVPLRPAKIIVCIGINNLQVQNSVKDIAVLYETLIVRLRSEIPNAKLVIHSILPCNDEYISKEYHAAANEAIRKRAVQHGLPFLGTPPEFYDAKGNIRPELFDGSAHLAPAGFQVWADFLRGYL
jgi:lysophospholipase L1-like esterase